jgi:hypothetical protein
MMINSRSGEFHFPLTRVLSSLNQFWTKCRTLGGGPGGNSSWTKRKREASGVRSKLRA